MMDAAWCERRALEFDQEAAAHQRYFPSQADALVLTAAAMRIAKRVLEGQDRLAEILTEQMDMAFAIDPHSAAEAILAHLRGENRTGSVKPESPV